MAEFLTRSLPKPCIVLAPTARCVTCTLPVVTLVTCNKNVSLQNKLRPVNYYIGYFSRFHAIICEYFRNTSYPMTCHLQARRLARLKGSKTFFQRQIVTSFVERFKAPQILSTAKLGKSVIKGVNSTSGDIHHCKTPLLICN